LYFGLSEEQNQLRASVRGYLGGLKTARAVVEGEPAHDPERWQRMTQEQGWQAILIAEEAGVFGFSPVDMAVVLEEVGRALSPSPLLSTAFATLALQQAESSQVVRRALADIAAGATAALALNTDIAATVSSGGWELSGQAQSVLGGAEAELVVVDTFEGVFLLRDLEFERRALSVFDPTRPLANLAFDNLDLPGDVRLEGVDVEKVRMGCEVLAACEAVGAAEAAMEMSVDYAKVRQQFGKAIGSFQAVQHKCADMMVRVESARSAAWYAAWAMGAQRDDARDAAHTAIALASDALTLCARENLQIHGGIGFTWEHDAHLFLKRAQANEALLGSSQAHRAAIADRIVEGTWS